GMLFPHAGKSIAIGQLVCLVQGAVPAVPAPTFSLLRPGRRCLLTTKPWPRGEWPMFTLQSFSPFFSFLTISLLMLVPSAAPAQTLPFDPVPGTEMVDTGTFGVLPREVVWKTDGREMVLIPQGSYTIGRPPGLRDEVLPSESPQATVTLGWY